MSLILGKELRVKVFENEMLKRILEPESEEIKRRLEKAS
jgi:hypothetical protein